MLNAALESLVQNVQGGVIINFDKIGPDPPAVEVKVENGLDSNAKVPSWCCRRFFVVSSYFRQNRIAEFYEHKAFHLPNIFFPTLKRN